jgi:capsular exopolysaccharide synthesis family protein
VNPGTYLGMLRKRWLTVALVTLLCLAIGGLVTLLAPKRYQASAQIFTSIAVSTEPAALAAANTFTTGRVQSYVSVASGPSVTDFVVKQLNLPMSSTQLSKEITADAPLNKVIINVHVTDKYAQRAAAIANAVAYRMSTVVEGLESAKAGSRGSPVSLTVTKPATTPKSPVSPRPTLNLGLALLIGLLLGVGLARLRDQYDDRIRSLEDVDGLLNCPVLAMLPKGTGRDSAEPFATEPLARQAFQQLQASLPFVNLDSPPRSICVTSPSNGDGKTYVAVNLAAALARSGDTVCLVEADLRAPSLVSLLKLPLRSGLTSAITGQEPVENVVQPVRGSLSAIGSGPVPPNPGAAFASEQARSVILRTIHAFRFTVLDSSSVVEAQDARVTNLTDATILVIRRGGTRRRDLVRTLDALAEVGVRPSGAVFTMVRRRDVVQRMQDVTEQSTPVRTPVTAPGVAG